MTLDDKVREWARAATHKAYMAVGTIPLSAGPEVFERLTERWNSIYTSEFARLARVDAFEEAAAGLIDIGPCDVTGENCMRTIRELAAAEKERKT